MAHESALVEGIGYGRWTRLQEIGEFAQRMGHRRIGLAHCPDTTKEALLAASYLRSLMLDVRLPSKRQECDPLGLARAFAGFETQLNIIAGMCVGHEATFVRSSQAPVTSFISRDERFYHNPAAALYTADTYSHGSLYGRAEREPVAFQGSDPDTLSRVSRELLPDKGDRWSRVEETIEFARSLGVTHIGVSFCVGFRHEARTLTRVLEANGFRVSSACCKTGAVPKEKLGIMEDQKVHPGQPEMICNSVAQAELLNRERVQLALILGQCVGHDSATLARLEAPAVTVVTKDRVLGHNTVAALYRLEG